MKISGHPLLSEKRYCDVDLLHLHFIIPTQNNERTTFSSFIIHKFDSSELNRVIADSSASVSSLSDSSHLNTDHHNIMHIFNGSLFYVFVRSSQ